MRWLQQQAAEKGLNKAVDEPERKTGLLDQIAVADAVRASQGVLQYHKPNNDDPPGGGNDR